MENPCIVWLAIIFGGIFQFSLKKSKDAFTMNQIENYLLNNKKIIIKFIIIINFLYSK